MQLLRNALKEGYVLLDPAVGSIETVFQYALAHAVGRGLLPEESRSQVSKALLAREEKSSTAIGHGVAIPHVYLDVIPNPIIVFIRLAQPLERPTPDEEPVRYLFVLLGPPGRAAEHLDTLMAIVRLMSDPEFRLDADQATSREELLDALDRYLARQPSPVVEFIRLPPEGLQYTGRLFGGFLKDIRRRAVHYASDFRDGFHSKSIASTLFLYFACLAPAVTFGGILAAKTDNHMGAMEMIVASAFGGVIYALLSGQPLIVLGGTGPLLVFAVMLYQLCGDLGLPFLETRLWVGMWTTLFLLMLAFTDASCLMRFFTRFTDEIFAGLISIIFIYEAIYSLVQVFIEVYQGVPVVSHDKALLSLILALGTFWLAMTLSRFRRSSYLRGPIREFIADFGPTLALVAMTLVAFSMQEVKLDLLPVPQSFTPTNEKVVFQFPNKTSPISTNPKALHAAASLSASVVAAPRDGHPWNTTAMVFLTDKMIEKQPRAWLISPFAVPLWACLAASIPAFLVTVLIYLDQNITARLVNNPDHKLKKGPAYHLDLALVGVLVGCCSFFGLPWLVAATVRSLNHLRSLATVKKLPTATGETTERVIHVRETRVTALAIHLLIGLSLVFLPYLRVIPMPVLYGLFLFMGVVSMSGNQFFERLALWPMDRNLYPRTHYIQKVPMPIIHLFTLIQVVCLAVLWLVKTSPLGILFPLFIALLVPVRFAMNRFFAPSHLKALDAEEEPEEEETEWV